MPWKPLTEEKLHDMLNSAWQRMSLPQRRIWEAIRIEPQKWASHPYGDLGGGFWAVALLGQTVVWFNDIEDGFNRSHYTNHGTIDAYWCNQDQLEQTIQHLLNAIADGSDSGGFSGPPQPLQSLGSSLGVATRTMKTAFFFITFLAAGFAALAANKPGFSEFFPGGVFSRNDDGNDAFISGWYASQLRAFKEPSLCTSPQKQCETYRFTMLPTFNFPLTVRIHIESDGTATAIAKRLTGKGGYDPGKLDFERTQTLTRNRLWRCEPLLQTTSSGRWQPHWNGLDVTAPNGFSRRCGMDVTILSLGGRQAIRTLIGSFVIASYVSEVLTRLTLIFGNVLNPNDRNAYALQRLGVSSRLP